MHSYLFTLHLTPMSNSSVKTLNNTIHSMSTQEAIDIEARIIEAAKQVFVRKGYEAATMSDIAGEAGIGRTALHYYFRTKEMLFDAIFGQLMSALLPNIGRIIDEGTSVLERLPKIIDQYVSLLQANPSFPVFVIMELNRDPEHLFQTVMKDPERIKPILRLRSQIEEEMESGRLKKMPIADVATTMVSLVVFPMLIQHPLSAIFMEGDTEKFNTFILNRKPLMLEVMTSLLTPDK